MIRKVLDRSYKVARRIVVAIFGGTILALGVVMLVTPGPALVVIPVGLAILSIEFAFARHWLRQVRERLSRNNANTLGERAEAHRERVSGNTEKKKAPES